MDKYIELAKKVKALAEHGSPGERDNAKQKLQIILDKYGIQLDELLEETIQKYWFKVKNKDLLHQLHYHVTGSRSYFTKSNKRGFIGFELTAFQYVEIKEKFDHYNKEYTIQVGIFYNAFIQKNELFPDPKKFPSEPKQLFEEEKERIRQLYKMMNGIEKTTLVRKLEKGGTHEKI